MLRREARISANNDSYLERARQLGENSKKPSDSAALRQKRHEERVAYARQQTQWRKDIIAQREAVQERVRLENRDVHDKIDLASLISEKVVAHSILSGKGEVTEGSEDALATFSRFRLQADLAREGWRPLNYRRGRIRTKGARGAAAGVWTRRSAQRSQPDARDRIPRGIVGMCVSKQFHCVVYAVSRSRLLYYLGTCHRR